MKSPLFWQVYERLLNADELDPQAKLAVEASFDGQQDVEDVLGGTFVAFEGDPKSEASQNEAMRAYLSSITVEGFRGIGPSTTLNLNDGPGLTLVVGRNGSGKSSFAEALEVLLTGDSLRWQNRKPKADWTAGWRNLHHQKATRIQAKLSVEGRKQPVTLRRIWGGDPSFDAGVLAADYGDRKEDGLDGLGWGGALESYRPILSYNELGNALDAGPAKLFDQLRDVLGMEPMTDAIDALTAVQKRLNKDSKVSKDNKPGLISKLQASEDPRAEAALKRIDGKNKIDLDALSIIAAEEGDDGGQLELLRRIASLKIPDPAQVLNAAKGLRERYQENKQAQESAAGHQLKTEKLLVQAMAWYESNQDDATCPVCGEGTLDDAWLESTKTSLAEANEGASQAKKAKVALQGAIDDAKRLIRSTGEPAASTLSHAELARTAYDVWTAGSSDEPLDLANHLETTFDALEDAMGKLKEEALAALETTRADWRPIRRALETWIDQHIESEKAKEDNKVIKAALAWLRSTDEVLRAERFEPIKTRATEIWNTLRHQSNVEMTDIRLEGKGTSRRATIEVAVDDTHAVALGVMSQGELHAMVLSLFLPRLTLPESPFGFLLIDDPVQAMDPAKVDGLANVLAEVAEQRQVIVFTHDARLPEAVRRLQIPATILQVGRREKSQVEVKTSRDPAKQMILDAIAVARDTDKVGPNLTGRVVPGLCRSALEARFKELAWHRQLAQGVPHAQVEAMVSAAQGIHSLATLVLLGDANKGKDLYTSINNTLGKRHTDTFVTLKDHAHKPYLGNAEELIRDTEGFLYALEQL